MISTRPALVAAALALTAASTSFAGARAEDGAQGPSAQPTIAGWDAFVDRLRALGPKMLAKLPADMQNDPQIQQELARLMLESLAAGAIGTISHDPDHPVFLPSLNLTLNVGQPNADTTYKQALIAPGGTYRLRGRLENVRIAKIGQMGAGSTPSQIRTLAYNDLNALKIDDRGRYDVVLSPERPVGYTGDWWKLEPTTSGLLLRLVMADWVKERDPTISIERLDAPATKPRMSASQLEAKLKALPDGVDRMAILLVDQVPRLMQQGYVNKAKAFDVAAIGGELTGQFYYNIPYRLADDEALIVSAKVPEKCGYFSLIQTNTIFETIDWYNNHSSLNDTQLHVDADGVLRVVVSAKDPGVANWLDTSGHREGAIQGRWTDCSAQPVPEVAKVKIGQVPSQLPAGTPKVTLQEREKIVRERRAALQQRSLW
jgi:Protein of unknown function (DUF1214)